MTYTDKELGNILAIFHLKIKVGHPNRTEAFISKIKIRLVLPLMRTNAIFESGFESEKFSGDWFPSSMLNGKSPYKMIYNKCHTLSHLRVFGCLCFATIVYNNDKFGSRYEKCAMIGYYSVNKGYSDIANVFQEINHIKNFDVEYPKIPNDDERVDPNINSDLKSQSDINNSSESGKSDYSLYTKSDKGVFLTLLVYVDDIIITGNIVYEIKEFKVFLKPKFMIKDLGKLKYFLGIEVIDTEKGICLNQRKYVLDLLFEYGEDVVVISSDKVKGSGDWNSPKYQETVVSKGKKVVNTLSLYKMETNEISERYTAPCFVNGLEVYDGEVNLELNENLISNEFAVKLCLDYEVKKGKKLVKKELIVALKGEIYFVNFIINPKEDDSEPGRDKVELDGKNVKEKDDVVKRIKGDALKEKDDPGAFIFPIRLEGKVNENALADTGSNINTMPYRIYETLGRDEMKKIDRGITMINHTQAEAMGKLSNILCQVGVTTIIAKFLMLDIQIDCDSPIMVGQGFLYIMAKSGSDDDEEYVITRNKFGAPIYGPKPAPYQNCTNLKDRSSAIQSVTNPF
nr:ribonuclease H-like domain-containing protein [Tanacetum cinerariifolium]